MLAHPLNAPSAPLLSVFKFTANSIPYRPLTFTNKSTTLKPKCPLQSRKRTRPLADIDNLESDSKKKRRLRLLLITSRLSRPFSTPATHIVDRGSSKIAVWAKKKSLVPQVLRKAAIMNHIRCRVREKEAWLRKDSGISVGEDERAEMRRNVALGEMELTRFESPNAINVSWPLKADRLVERVAQPSPLGLSNYDALDDEDGYGFFDEEENGGESDGTWPQDKITEKKASAKDIEYYSDWNCFDNTEDRRNVEDEDEFDDPFSLSVLYFEMAKEKRPPSPPDGKIEDFLKEKEREKEVLMMGFNAFNALE